MRETFGQLPRLPWRRRVLRIAQVALWGSGAAGAYLRLGRPASLTVLMYHSVAHAEQAQWITPRVHLSPRTFEAQMRFLARHRTVVGLDALLEQLSRGEPIRPGTVVVTFDDGYLDNLEVAAPILRRYELPAVLYLCTGYVSRGQNQWSDVLYSFLKYRRRQRLTLGARTFDLDTSAGRVRAFAAISGELLSADADTRAQLLDSVMDQLRPSRQPPRLTLVWDEVRQLAHEYPNFLLGVHTADHLDLSALAVPSALAEVERCIQEFESEMGELPSHFSYPYSRPHPAVSVQLANMGFRTAATTAGAHPQSRPDPLALTRIEATDSPGLLRYWTSGAHPRLSAALLGRA